jgi:hypothetical protein
MFPTQQNQHSIPRGDWGKAMKFGPAHSAALLLRTAADAKAAHFSAKETQEYYGAASRTEKSSCTDSRAFRTPRSL